MTSAIALYGQSLRRTAAGATARLHLLDPGGEPLWHANPGDWFAPTRPGDAGLLRRCTGPTLDVGCGPGRLAAALHRSGREALGIDISAEAVRQARRRGARAVRRCVFGPVPGEGAWRNVLLADGNVGIGGDPARLLRRCAELAAPTGSILAELAAPGTAGWSRSVVLFDGQRRSSPFGWAVVGVDDIAEQAAAVSLRPNEIWQEAGRWFAELVRA